MPASKFNPYPGPRPFTPDEYRIFAGRDDEISELSSLIVAHRAVLLYARSGAGKSSLLNAGLRPALAEKGVRVLRTARVGIPLPKAVPLEMLRNVYTFNVLGDLLSDFSTEEELVRRATFAEGLAHIPHELDEAGDPILRVIPFDQFEEFFNSYPQRWRDRREFFSEVADALRQDPSLRILFLLREDYLADFNEFATALSDGGRTRYRLDPLREPEALAAVRRPLEGTPWRFARGVDEALVKDLTAVRAAAPSGDASGIAGEFVEPVQLQVVCYELFERLPPERSEITAAHLSTFGGADEALRLFYDRALRTAVSETGVSENELRSWFRAQLITPAATRGMVFQDRDSTGGIPNDVVRILEREHVVRAELRSGSRWFELPHDRLIQPILNSNRDFVLASNTAKAAEEGERKVRIREANPTRSDTAAPDIESPSGRSDCALCLSGGGFRSVLFQAGVLLRLNELGMLQKINQYSAVSAGAIVAAKLGLEWNDLEFEAGISRSLFSKVIDPLIAFTSKTLDSPAIFAGIFLPGGIVERVIDSYRSLLYGDATLQDFPGKPRIVLSATNVQTGSLWRFSKPYMADYRVGRISNPTVTLSRAVAASAANPPVFSPVVLDLKGASWDENPSELNSPAYRDHVVLTDGRMYDTLALETAWKRCDTILVSDSGTSLNLDPEPHSDSVRHSFRLFEVLDSQVRGLRRRQVIEALALKVKRGAYWGNPTPGSSIPALNGLPCPVDRTEELARIPSRMAALSPDLQRRLINWGYATCDAAYRSSMDPLAPPPGAFPYPQEGV